MTGEDLKAKLAAKIAALRSAREPKAPREDAPVAALPKAPVKPKKKFKHERDAPKEVKKTIEKKPAPVQTSAVAKSISFGRVKVGEQVETRLRQVAPGTKKKRLQKWLNDAEKNKKQLEDLRQTAGDDAAKRKDRETRLSQAVKRAKGERVAVSDVGKIKKTMKLLQKKKDNSTTFWTDKKSAETEAKNQRIAKREENINKFKKHIKPEEGVDKTGKAGGGESKGPGEKLSRKQRANEAKQRAKVKEARDKRKKSKTETDTPVASSFPKSKRKA